MIENLGQNKQAKEEYFKLLVILNGSNKFKSEKTKILFYFDKGFNGTKYLIAKLSDKRGKIVLATELKKIWRPTRYSGLINLENLVVKVLNQNKDVEDPKKLLINEIFK